MTNETQPLCKLKFNKSILPTVHARVSPKELLNRLKELSDELSTLNQDQADRSSYQKVAQSLVDPKLLQSSSMGVQAYTCCAISDILRIEAPNAPYSVSQLSDAFKAFFQQLKKLGEPENPFYSQQCYLLRRLAEVRSAILVTDLPDAATLSTEIFTIFLGHDNVQLNPRLEPLMADILGEIVSELEVVPTAVLKLILGKFTPPEGDSALLTTGYRSNISNPGQKLAVGICEANIDRMSRLLAQYVSEILYEGGAQRKNDNHNTMNTLNTIHALCVQIWRYIPEMLDAIMSLFTDELDADDPAVRCLAVDTIGQMIALNNPGSASAGTPVNFFIKHKNAWLMWLKKVLDISPEVRVRWVLQLKDVLCSAGAPFTMEVNTQLSKCLHKCLLDTDEKVRFAACSLVANMPFESFCSRICSKDILTLLTRMTRERHARVRNEVITSLGKLYDGYIKGTNRDSLLRFGSHCEQDVTELNELFEKAIPNLILGLVYLNDPSITAQMDLCLFDYLLPVLHPHADERVDRILRLYHALDTKGKALFDAIGRRQSKMAEVIDKLALAMQEYNKACADPDADASDPAMIEAVLKLEKILQWLCVGFPPTMDLYQCFERLYQLKRPRFIHLLQVSVSVDSDYRTVVNSINELLSKLSDAKNIRITNEKNKVACSDMVSTMKLLLLRSSNLFNNGSNVEQFYKFAQTKDPRFGLDAAQVLQAISETSPGTLKPVTKDIIEAISDDNDHQHPHALSFLKVLSNYYKNYPAAVPNSILFKKALGQYIKDGAPNQAKHAMEIICLYEYKDDMLDEIIDAILPLSVNKPTLSSHLAALASLFAFYPAMIPERGQEITNFVIKQVFMGDQRPPAFTDDIDIENLDYDQLHTNHPILSQKMIALQFLVNRIGGLIQMTNFNIDEETIHFTQQAAPVLKLLSSYISKGGEITPKGSRASSPELYKKALRLSAGTHILELGSIPHAKDLISSTEILALGVLVCDQDEIVRKCFMVELQRRLSENSAPDSFMLLVFLGGVDPIVQRANETALWIKTVTDRCQQSNLQTVEGCLPNLIHLLSHHQVFDQAVTDEEMLLAYTLTLRVISFFVNLVANSESVSLLYYLASRVRQYRDATTESDSTNLYRVAELAQYLIKGYADSTGCAILPWPTRIILSSKLFTGITSREDAQEISARVFIPDKMRSKLSELLKNLVGLITQQSTKARVSRSLGKRSATKSKSATKPKRNVQAGKPRIARDKASIRKRKNDELLVERPKRQSRRTSPKTYYEDSDQASGSEEFSDS